MKPSDPIPAALEEIALLLRQGNHIRQAIDIEDLRQSALSPNCHKYDHFCSQITQNKWYWGGMGTIADISFQDRALDGQFKRAYFKLADACESEGLASVHSQSIANVFGQWIKDGIV
jgi:hypothetical protein